MNAHRCEGRDTLKVFHVLAGGIIGLVTLSILTLLFHWLFFRPALRDGQHAFVFFVTVPVGFILGVMTELIRGYLSEGQAGKAGSIACFGGGFLTILFLFVGLFVFSGTENPTLWERLTTTLFWFGLPLLWSGMLLRMGLRLFAGG